MNEFPTTAAFGAEYGAGIALENMSWDELKRFSNIAVLSDYLMEVNKADAADIGIEPWITRQEANALAARLVDENAAAE